MGFRFRRSLKIAPGVRLNFGKRGFTSWSIGGRGAKVNIGSKGVRQTIGLPGTGLSFTSLSKGGRPLATSRHVTAPATIGQQSLPLPSGPPIDAARFAFSPIPVPRSAGRGRILLLVCGGLMFLLGTVLAQMPEARVIGVLLVLIAFAFRTRKRLVANEDARVQALAREERDRRVAQLGAAIGAISGKSTLTDLRNVLAMPQQLALTDAEVAALPLQVVHGAAELLEFEAACDGKLPSIAGHENTIGEDESCFFVGAAVYDKRGDNDPTGMLYLTTTQMMFVSPDGLTTAPFSKVISADRDGCTLRIQRRDRQTPYAFVFSTHGPAMKAEYITKNLLASARSASV